jgi:hypothetical protein
MVRGDQETWNTMVNKHYPEQFKADPVALYRSRPGTTIAQVTRYAGSIWLVGSTDRGYERTWVVYWSCDRDRTAALYDCRSPSKISLWMGST